MSECAACHDRGASCRYCDKPYVPDGYVLLSPADREKVREIVLPSGPRPCDCDSCDCGNFDDARAVGAWDERNGIADLVLALIEGRQA